MQRDTLESIISPPRPRTKAINRPGTWFGGPSFGKQPMASSSTAALVPSSSSSSSSSTTIAPPNIFTAQSFRSPLPSKGKHKLSPSPSPRHEEDFVMISPPRQPQFSATRIPSGLTQSDSGRSSSPPEDSPTPACGMASATARLKLVDDDSPIRRIPGQSRSLRGAIEDGGRSVFLSTAKMRGFPASPLKSNVVDDYDDDGSPRLTNSSLSMAPPPQPLFPPLRSSQSQDCDATISTSRIPRLSTSHPIRARASTDADRPKLAQKKAISLDAIPTTHDDEPFGHPITALGKKSRATSSAFMHQDSIRRAHKRINSGDHLTLAGSSSISRSFGQKSGLALSLTPSPGIGVLPDLASNSSLSSLSTANMTPPASAFSPAEPPIFEDVRPLAEAFETTNSTVSRKFKPRDSGVSMGEEEKSQRKLVPPPSVFRPALGRPRRPPMLKRTSSMGDERPALETPSITPNMQSGWPGADPSGPVQPFDFLGESGAGLAFSVSERRPSMPDTPVKKHSYGHSHGGGPFGHRVSQSMSQPSLSSDALPPLGESTKPNVPMQPPPTVRKPPPTAMAVPHLMLTTTSSPDSPNAMDQDQPSPTVRMGPVSSATKLVAAPPSRVGMLRRTSSGANSSESEEESTPTKGSGDRTLLAPRSDAKTPTPSPGKSRIAVVSNSSIYPRLSLPAFAAPKQHRTLHHRQSHPATANLPEQEDEFEKRFITLETLGKGAFSTVLKVQEREGDGLYAVKKARGVFDGVKDRLRHLEEVDILRHLSKNVCPHVIKFENAWEQNRQLFIQTELCLGSLAFFLEEYGRVVERLDEGRVWKIIRELSDGINHIHSSGVIHFDIKPANILISATGSLKIGDFGLATRWPRLSAAEIIYGSGLGGVVPHEAVHGKLEREGDRVYMPPEMLRGLFVMAADIFSFGLVILEVSTNICVPDGGGPWQALRSNDFSVVDLSPLSPALSDLIIQCMSADPACRPTIGHIVSHPIVQRARSGKDALAPEDPRWLVEVLTGFAGQSQGGVAGSGRTTDGDVVMSE